MSIADIGFQGNQTPSNYTGNTHGGMCEVNGQWYIFYHRQTNRIKCSRQACAEKLTILPDGSIPQVEVSSCGLNHGPLSGKGTYEARIACNLGGPVPMVKSDHAKKLDKQKQLPYFTQSGEDRERDGDQYLANLQNGAWCGFMYFSFDGSEQKISVRVRGSAAGTLQVFTDRSKPAVAEIRISPSASWADFRASFRPEPGIHPLFFVYTGAGALDFFHFHDIEAWRNSAVIGFFRNIRSTPQ